MSKIPNILEFAAQEGFELTEMQQMTLAMREKGIRTFVLLPAYQVEVMNAIWEEYTNKYTLSVKPKLD